MAIMKRDAMCKLQADGGRTSDGVLQKDCQ